MMHASKAEAKGDPAANGAVAAPVADDEDPVWQKLDFNIVQFHL